MWVFCQPLYTLLSLFSRTRHAECKEETREDFERAGEPYDIIFRSIPSLFEFSGVSRGKNSDAFLKKVKIIINCRRDEWISSPSHPRRATRLLRIFDRGGDRIKDESLFRRKCTLALREKMLNILSRAEINQDACFYTRIHRIIYSRSHAADPVHPLLLHYKRANKILMRSGWDIEGETARWGIQMVSLPGHSATTDGFR